jgi:methyl-accepting chemotaxis protein
MRITLKTKIWITVLAIVLMFAFFISFYFPAEQEKLLLKNYNKEVQNFANTVELGVKIALTEQNFEGVQTAMQYLKDDPRLRFISLLQIDTLWNNTHTTYHLEKKVFKTFPEGVQPNPNQLSNDSIIVKYAPFTTPIMNGAIMLAFSTREIIQTKKQIRLTSLIVSLIVFVIGIIIGFWLAKTISVPVLELRDAANKVGNGDLTQRVESHSNDEIGELGLAFNKMVDDLGKAHQQVEQRTKELVIEKKKSDELLLNILPAETAEELKINGTAKAKNYDSVTVLFADFKSFTKISETLSPEKLVNELNYLFSAFDRIIQKYNLEKIKTIGDAYMCAGGLPNKNNTHAKEVVAAALEMMDVVKQYTATKKATG